jgi:hypothetical protein
VLKVPLTDALTVKTRRCLRRSLVAGPIDIISQPSSDAASIRKTDNSLTGRGSDMVFQNISTSQTDYCPEKPHRQNRGGQGEKSGTTRRWRRKTLKLLKTDFGNGAGGISGHGQRKVAQKRT